ncbi:MAG: PAS domain S-box protein [Burkholderiales bacterium]|nr:PAS domain S-box protein [Burkholderiales bacterium]
MMNERIRLRVLIVEDQPLDAELVERELQMPGFEPACSRVETESAFRAALADRPDIVLSDYHLPQFSGLRALAILRESGLEIPFILISGGINEEQAVEVMRLGADDFLLKDRLGRLGAAITGAIERRQLRVSARQTEQRHRTTFEHAPIGITHTRLDGRFIEINPQACEILGYPREELLTRTFLDITHPDDRETSTAFRKKLIAGGDAGDASREKRYIRRDQSIVWVTVSVALVRQPDGAPDYFVTMFQDISSRKSAEERFRTTFEQATVGIVHSSLDDRYLLANRRFCEMLGYSLGEILGMGPGNIVHPEDKGRDRPLQQDLLAGKIGSFSGEKRYRRKDGSVIWVNRTVSLARDESGKPQYLIRVVEDITRRKEEEERFRATFDQSAIGIALTLPSGQYLTVNDRLCEMLGYTREELLAKSAIDDITYPDDREGSRERLAKLLRGEVPHIYAEKRYLRKDGGVLHITRSMSLVRGPDGKPRYIISMITDVTGHKAAEDLFTASFEQAGVGMTLRRPGERKSSWLRINQKFCDMLGYTRDELMRLGTADVTLPEDQEAAVELNKKLVSGEISSYARERRYLRKDGRIIWCDVSITAVQGSDGKPSHIISVIQDITDRKQAEVRLEQTFEQAAVGIVRTDLERRIIAANHKFCEMLGYSKQEFLGLKMRQISHPDDQGKDADARLQLVHGKMDHLQSERRYIRKDGSFIWVRRTTSLARDLANDASHYIFVVEDITARRMAEESYRATFDNAPIGIMHSTADLRILHVNPKLCEILGYTREELLAMRTSDFLSPDDRKSDRSQYLQQMLKGEMQTFSSERPFVRKDGSIVWTNRTVSLVRDSAGQPLYFLRIIEDISERKRAEDALAKERLLLRTVVDAIPDRIYVKDVEGRFILQNAANLKVRGVDHHEDIVGKTVFDIFPPQLARRIHEEDQEIIRTGEPLIDRESRTHFGTGEGHEDATRWHLTSKVPLKDAAGRVYGLVGVNRDITERKQSSERLAHLAHYDSVTGLPNRVLLHDRLGQSIAQARRNSWFVGVLFLDLDRFKLVNDTLGHAAGDLLLKQVAMRLTQALRPSDTVGRLSGDEFAVILPELATPQNAGLVAQKLIDILHAPFDLDGNEVFVTASIGITIYPTDSDSIETLIRDADAAMYGAKSAGRNNYQYYTAEMNQRATEKLRLETRLRRAIEREEFVLHYQPKVDIATGKITGLEALLRWQSPDEGLVGPDQFIPMLEETGLIVQVGDWVARQACARIHAWRKAGITPVPVAVNLSARQLRQAGFGATLGRALAEFSVPAELIEIEITESSLMENPEQAIVVLTEIEKLGVRLSADDFGTGYSSLSYLKRLPLNALKIDRSFVRDITTDPDDAAITKTVITLAHGLDLKVIAEGVETEEQLAFLGQNQCDEAQGYLFSRPLTVAACTELLSGGNPLHPARRPETADDIPAVLLVDDDSDHLMLTRLLLQRDGHRVLETTSTRDAFELLATNRAGIIISDENMPGMSGVEFLRRVKSMYPDAMRIMFSGAGDFGTATAAINEGEVHKFFVKGRDEDLLSREISKKFRQDRAHQP